MPQQLKVSLTGPNTPVAAGSKLTASIDGRFLYGAPAAGLHAEGTVRLVRDEHPVPDAKEYTFGIAGETIPDAVQTLTLDDADQTGHVAIDTALDVPAGLASPLRAELDAGLTEPGGRAVRDTLSVPVRTHAVLIGLRKMFGEQVDTGDAATFAVRSFDADGKPLAKTGLNWRLVHELQHWDWWRGNDGNSPWTFHYYTFDSDIAKGTLDVPADRPAELARTLDWGNYRLIVSDPVSGAASSVRFSVGWGGGDAAADVPDRLEVTTDRPVLAPGQTAQVHLHGPFAGAAQVTIESGGTVLETRRLDLPADRRDDRAARLGRLGTRRARAGDRVPAADRPGAPARSGAGRRADMDRRRPHRPHLGRVDRRPAPDDAAAGRASADPRDRRARCGVRHPRRRGRGHPATDAFRQPRSGRDAARPHPSRTRHARRLRAAAGGSRRHRHPA